ncbi:phage tail tape measure protein [Cytobacillus praedii]|nr:phage tail tape measure protein [Cytobacillus praedii]
MGMAKEAASTTDRIDKLSQKIGMSRQGFQEWEFILSQSGTDIEKLQAGFKTLNQRMDESARNTGKGSAAFNQLGIDVKDLAGNMKSQEQVFEESVRALQGLPDGAEKSRLAFELFGKAGLELMPLLNGTAESVDEMKAKARELGLVLSDEAIDAGVAFTDTMDQLERSFKSVFTQIGVGVMPILTKFADYLIANMPTIQKVIQVAFDVMAKVISVAVDWISKIADWIGKLVSLVKDWAVDNKAQLTNIKEIFETALGKIVEVGKTMWEFWKNNILPILLEWFEWIKKHLPTVQSTFQTVFSKIVDVAKAVWSFFKENILPILQRFFEFASSKIPLVKSIFETAFNIIKNVVEIVWGIFKNLLLPILKALWDWISPHIPKVQKVVETAFDAIFWVVDKVVGVFEAVTKAIKTAIDWLGSWNDKPAKDKNVNVNTNYSSSSQARGKPRYAFGTNYHRGGLAIVGELGPELVHLPRGAKVDTASQTKNNKLGETNINQKITIISPEPMSPSETARKSLQAQRQLVMEWGF